MSIFEDELPDIHENESEPTVVPEPSAAEPVLEPVVSPEPAIRAADEAIDSWFVAHFHNLGARLDVDLFNAFHAAKEELKVLIAKL